MDNMIAQRFKSLDEQGQSLIRHISSSYESNRAGYYVRKDLISEYEQWLNAVANLIKTVALPGSHYPTRLDAMLAHGNMSNGVVSHVVRQVYGLLTAAHQDWSNGLLRKIEFIVAAATFDDFLDQAQQYVARGRKMEAAVLASAVLEDSVKKVAVKAGEDPAGLSLEPLIDMLVKADALTPVKAKRWKSFAGIRNKALHAEWEGFDLDDVKALLFGLREIVVDL